MNIVNKVTLRHLKENKRRTLVTIIGVIISVAMITAVATLGVSFLDLMKRQTIADQGEWHVRYNDVNKEQLAAIKKDKATESVILSRDIGYAPLQNSENENKPYLFIKEYNKEGYEKFPIELAQGRLPKTANEVVISDHIATNAKVEYKIGDTLTLDVGERAPLEDPEVQYEYDLDQSTSFLIKNDEAKETLINQDTKSYTVVGIIKRPTWEPTWAPGYTIISYVDENAISADNPANASVILKKVNGSLYDHAEALAKKNNIEKVGFNNELLRYYGITNNNALKTTLYSLSAIIMAIIMIGSVALIYNAFAISVSERARHLGMLSSVGATKRQKQNSVFFEGALIGIISIPIGIISGLVGIGITFWFINSFLEIALGTSEKLLLTVTPVSIIAACAISMLTIFISTYLPARKASKISAIDAIRQTQDVKLTRKAVKTSKLVRKLFGIEAEIGLKNLKRNKRRYQATVLSLVISILLFLTVSYFTDNLKKSLVLSQANINFDIQVYTSDYKNPEITEQMKQIAKIPDVTESNLIKELSMTSWIDEQFVGEAYKKVDQEQSILKDGKFPYNIIIHSLDEESLEAYAKKVGADIEKLKDPNNPSAIVIDTIPFQDYNSGKYVESKVINTERGNSIDLYSTVPETGKVKQEGKIEIAALTDEQPLGAFSSGINVVNLVVSEQVLDQFLNDKNNKQLQTYLYLKSSDPMETQQSIEKMNESNLHVYNVYQSRQQDEQMVLLMSVFTYGFIALITAISIANIFNTISTSISLRKREFAMLKSVGMTPKGFNKMINYESIFYGIKALLYGLPLSIAVMYLIYKSLMNSFSYGFTLPWLSILYVIIAIFLIVGAAMLYSISKIKRENIIDVLKQENI